MVRFHVASSYGLHGLLGVNASKSSHDAGEMAGEGGRGGHETLPSAEVQDLSSNHFYRPTMSQYNWIFMYIHSLLS